MNEIYIDNKDGNVWDITSIVTGATWKTSRYGKASSLEISFVKNGIYQNEKFRYNNGDIIRYRKDGFNVFYGYIFSIEDGRSEEVRLTAYDQMRYLLYHDDFLGTDLTATEVIQKIAKDLQLQTGMLEDTGHRIPRLVEENKKRLDVICKALDQTVIATQQIYVFYDDFGKLTLRNAADMRLDFYIGDDSLMVDYRHKRSIDGETYNRVKLVQENEQSGNLDVYVLQDDANIARWGQLQMYEKADAKMNPAQIAERLENLLLLKNREQQSLTIPALGDFRVRAGCYVPIRIKSAGIDQYFLVDECSHQVSGAVHTMDLTLRVV